MVRKILVAKPLAAIATMFLLPCGRLCAEKKSPNILFILADDLGWKDLSYTGSRFYESPYIDSLAREGIVFTDAYAAAPVSSPSRVSLQTGRYPVRSGITDVLLGRYYYQKALIDSVCPVLPPEYPLDLPLSEMTIAEKIKESGYNTYFVGKWHCSEDSLLYPQHRGYDVNFAGSNRGDVGKNGYFAPYNIPGVHALDKDEYLTDRIGDEAIKMIENNGDSPFFMFLSFYQVHVPLVAKQEKIRYFKEKARRLGLDTLECYNDTPDWWSKQPFDNPYRDRLLQSDPVYAAMISIMDENIGKILSVLKEKGLYDNTVIIFTSDNGGLATSEKSPTSNLPLKGGKGHLYEGGIRVPLVVKMNEPYRLSGYSDAVVSGIDFFPTILDIAGEEPLHNLDGQSFLPVLKDLSYKMSERPVFWHFPHYPNHGGRPAGAVRYGDYKLIEFFDTGEKELYFLKTDIGEQKNLISAEKQIADKLSRLLEKWQQECAVKMPVKNQKYKCKEN